jgi:hypothetical protein
MNSAWIVSDPMPHDGGTAHSTGAGVGARSPRPWSPRWHDRQQPINGLRGGGLGEHRQGGTLPSGKVLGPGTHRCGFGGGIPRRRGTLVGGGDL